MESEWGKIRDLPESERAPFEKWLYGQTRPLFDNGDIEDAYYLWDYERWKAGLPVID